MMLRTLIVGLSLTLLVACDSEVLTSPPSEAEGSQQAPLLNDAQRAALKDSYAATPFTVLSIAELSFDHAPAITVTFASPLDPKSRWRDYLHIALEDGKAPEGDWILGDNFTTVYFPFIEAQTRYRVGVKSGLTSLTGRQLQDDVQKNLSTRNKEQSVKFISYGTQLSPRLAEGLTIEAVNVSAVDVDFFKIRAENLSDFFARNKGDGLYELKRIRRYGDLVYSARFDLNNRKNTREKSVLPITELKALKQAGVYFAVMREAGEYAYEYPNTWFTLGDIGLQVRQFERQIVAFTHHALTTKPAGNVSITLFDNKAQALASATTSADGFAQFSPLAQAPDFAIAQSGEHFSVLKLRNPAMDLSEYRLPSRRQKPLELFLYAPRNLYRPGETVHINALLRDADARFAGSPPIKASITTPDARVYQSIQWQGDAQAFYTHSFSLPKDAVRGEWQLQAILGNGDLFNYSFNVEDFLPERMKLQLKSPQGTHISTQANIEIGIQGDYLYGAPAAGNRVEATMQASAARSLFEDWDGFIFGAEDYRDYNTTTELPSTELNDQGQATLTLPNEWQGATQALKLLTRVSLFESGGRPVTRAITQYLWPRDALIGIRPTWTSTHAQPNSNAVLELIQVNSKGEQTAASDVDVLVLRESRQYYWQWNDGWQSNRNNEVTPIFNRVLNLSANERTPISVPVEYGHYRVEVRNRQQELLASYRFYSGWRWDKPAEGETGRPDKIALSWEANDHSANRNAPLNIEAPYAGTALITVEADQLLWHTSVALEAGQNQVAIPVNKEWQRHDIYATVNLLRKGPSAHKVMPKRAIGLIHLPLDRRAQNLGLSIQVPQKTQPDTQVVAKVKVQNTGNSPVFLTLSAVDTGVLRLSNFRSPKPFDWFFEPRAYTTELRDTWASFIEQLSDTRARQRFGGDADDELARGGQAPQTDVQVVDLYSGKVSVDANGEAEIPLDLPYFNGELRVMAVAWSEQAYGQFDTTMKVAAPLIAEVSTPRFLANGDQADATFDVQNLTESAQTLSVGLAASTELGGEQLSFELGLAAQEKRTLKLPLVAGQSSGAGQVSIAIKAVEGTQSSADLALERSWTIGLRPAYPAIAIQTQETLNAGASFVAPAYSEPPFEVAQQQMHLSVSSEPPLNLGEHLQQLIQYPYGCLEQTTSRLWPLLVSSQSEMRRYLSVDGRHTARQTASTKTPDSINLINQRADVINAALGRLSGMERGDGSFGLWSNQSKEEHWLSAYVTDALIRAKQQGYAVDDGLLDRAMQRLKAYVAARGKLWSESQHYSRWPNHYHFSYRAYAALVLARKQQVTLGELRNLYDNVSHMAKTQLPLAQLALALELSGDVRRAQEAWDKALAKSPRPLGYAGDYGTAVRDLAWISALAMESKLVNNPLANLMQLRDELLNQRWLSTQDRWALFKLGHALEENTLDEWMLALSVDDGEIKQTQNTGYSKMWQGEQVPSDILINNPNGHALFINLSYSGYPTKAPEPVSDGIDVKRMFYTVKGEPSPLTPLTSGDLVLVRLDISSTEGRIPDALVVDLLPAGFELENQNLDTAVKMQDIRVENKSLKRWLKNSKIVHEEYRDDRYVAAIDLTRGSNQIFYLMRAVTPGTYTVPPSLVEDMYRPWLRAVGKSEGQVTIAPK